MALYEITQDCRVANNEYQKGDIVSDTEVGGFYPTVMKPTNGEPKKARIKEEAKKDEGVEEEIEEKKPAKKQRKKK